ncbi:hypothetical protein HYC85_003990 [Camellia sinensis]|uniref:G-patch domain-containing protein n=1 Tax=Camellia sinensis TaxID=4442 RepID=A0A7J7HW75_CAMSI|nr:hypothetical protein HYC85_003990 [Camellia sinensis]
MESCRMYSFLPKPLPPQNLRYIFIIDIDTYVLNNNNNNYVQVSANNTQISQPSDKKPKILNWQEQRKLKRENRQEEIGYTLGPTLGKKGSGLAEPVGLEIRRTRAGIGQEDSRKEKRKREEERMEWEKGKEEELMEDFGCRHKEQWRSWRIVVNYHKAKAVLEQLENKEVVAEADKDEEDAENEEEEKEIITEEELPFSLVLHCVDTPFLTILKTWTSPLEHSVIIHVRVRVRLEFPDVSATCLASGSLDSTVLCLGMACWPSPYSISHGLRPPTVFCCHRPNVATLYLAKQSMFDTSFLKICFSQNDLPDLDSLVQIKNCDNLRVLNCSEPTNE